MKSTLDFDTLRDTLRPETLTVHDLTKKIEKQTDQLKDIAKELAKFSQEHKGIWVYTGPGDVESKHRADEAEALYNELKRRKELYEQRRRQAEERARAEKSGADEHSGQGDSDVDSPDDETRS